MRLLIIISVSFIFALGLMMIFNTSSADILDRSLDRSFEQDLIKQMMYACVGGLLSFLVWKVGYQHMIKLSPLFLIFLAILLVCVFIPGMGKVRNGAHRWMGVGGFTFQPSEFVKYFLLMFYVDWATKTQTATLSFLKFFKMALLLGIPIGLVMIEPDNGTAAVMGASLIPLFFLSKIRFKYWAFPMLIMICLAGAVAYKLPYVRGRIAVYLHPELDIKGKGHQPHQAKIAAGSGRLFGRGVGASLQKLTYLPEAQNDYIAAIYAEEFGFVGITVLILLYMLLAFGGFSIALYARTPSATLLAMGITFLISFQAFINLGVVSGLLPSKGVNLPFFSQGGTSLIANLIGLTLLLNIPKEAHSHEKENS